MRRAFALLAGCLALNTFAASFDCARARTAVERSICASPGLDDLDTTMGRYFEGAIAGLRENAACLRSDQREWLRARRDTCKDPDCLKAAYLDRLSELSALQPGINTQRRLPLPPRATLVWAIAPDTDPYGAPRVASSPTEVEGTLDYGMPPGGYFLRDAAGDTILIMTDMSISGSSADALPSILKANSQASLVAKGRIARDRGQRYFDRRHCVYLHRLP